MIHSNKIYPSQQVQQRDSINIRPHHTLHPRSDKMIYRGSQLEGKMMNQFYSSPTENISCKIFSLFKKIIFLEGHKISVDIHALFPGHS